MVVLGHILNYANPKYDIVPYVLVQQFLDSFHMPAFFILSGMLTDGDKWRGRSVGSFLLISIDGLSMTTNVSAVAACFNNIGPGFDVVGPTCNFSVYSWFSKLVLIFDMLAGRLEI